MIQKLFKAVLIVLAVLLLVSFLLPRQIAVARSLIMNAPVEKIFPLVNSPKNMMKWSPWVQRDATMVVTFSGAASGKGAISKWKSKTEGEGQQKIIDSRKNLLIVMALDFGSKGKAEARFAFRPLQTGRTRVSWGFTTDAGYNPIMRWMGLLLFDGWIGKDYEQGLQNLKKMVEGKSS